MGSVPSVPEFPERIVAEGRGPHTRIHGLRQPILEVPGEAAALGVREGIAVCVVGNCEHRCRR